MKLVSIRQPGYLPYLGFFKKIESTDIFVFLDDVQYTRSDWDNRNKIGTNDEPLWLTVPVLNKSSQLLNEVEIDNTKNWIYKHLSAIEYNYNDAPFFIIYWEEIKKIIKKPRKKLIELNLDLLNYFIIKLEIKSKIILSSSLNINETGSKKLLEICKSIGCDTYLSGELGKDYLDDEIFEKENIKVIYEKFEHPKYYQKFENFVPNLSIIDLLFNEGENSKNILKKSKNF